MAVRICQFQQTSLDDVTLTFFFLPNTTDLAFLNKGDLINYST